MGTSETTQNGFKRLFPIRISSKGFIEDPGDGLITLVGRVHPNGEFEPFDGKSKERVNVKDGRIYFVVDGKEQELGRILPDGEIEPLGEPKDKKGKTLTPEEMKAKLEAEVEKRRRELFTEICHPPVVTISPDHPAGQNSDTKLVAIKESDKFSIFPDGTINKIGKVLPNGEFEPSDGFCVRDGILYQLVKIGKLSPTWDIEPIEPIREKVDSETKTPPTKFEVTRDGVIISHGGTGLNCIIGEVLPNGEVKPKDGWSCDFRVRDGIIYLVHNGKEEEIGRITEEMKEGFEKRRLEGEKLVENLEKMRRKKLEEKLKNGGEK